MRRPPAASPRRAASASCATICSHGFSRPMVVWAPWPGNTVRPSSSVASRESDSTMASALPPGRSVRPQAPAKRVSPESSTRSSWLSRQTEPSVWPGVCSTVRSMSPKRIREPSLRSRAGHARRDGKRCRHRVRLLQPVPVGDVRGEGGARGDDRLGVVADVIPVAVRADDHAQVPALVAELLGQPPDRGCGGIDGDSLTRTQIGQHPDVGGRGPGREL